MTTRKTLGASQASRVHKADASKSNVVWFVTTAKQGDMRAPGALKKHLTDLNLSTSIARAQQVHGPQVAVVGHCSDEETVPNVDGLITAEANQPLAIFTADCLSLFVHVPKRHVIAMLHAGWRGVRAQILKRAVREMKKRWDVRPREIDVWRGPAIGPCCFEVRWDVARYFPATRRRRGDRWTVDLAREMHRQARGLGLHWRRERDETSCTAHEKKYYSYRRTATTDRQVSVIVIPAFASMRPLA